MVTHRWWGNKFCKRAAKAHTSVNLRSAEIKSVAGTDSSARETVSSFSTLQTNEVLTGTSTPLAVRRISDIVSVPTKQCRRRRGLRVYILHVAPRLRRAAQSRRWCGIGGGGSRRDEIAPGSCAAALG
jgi:hypothetical protein